MLSNQNNLKELIDKSDFSGGTNLVLGVEEAVNKFKGNSGRVIMLADISDNALTRSDNYNEMTERAKNIATVAKDNGIIVDYVLLGTPDKSNDLVSAYLSVPNITGGNIYYADTAKEFPPLVEDLFFNSYSYNIMPITGINSTDKEQQIDIKLPTSQTSRCRIYVSAKTPAEGLRATYASAELGAEINSSYSMIDLTHPAQDGITLFLDTGTNTSTKVYLIADYNNKTIVTVDSVLENREKEARQKTTINLKLVDKTSDKLIFSQSEQELYTPDITLISPSGKDQKLDFTVDKNEPGSYTSQFYPNEFGDYTINGNIVGNNITLPIAESTFEVESLVPQKNPVHLPTLLSIIIGILLITAAILFYLFTKKKKEVTNRSAVELDRVYGFTGKLHFAAILADGGRRDLQPFTFYLDKIISQKRLSLKEIYAASSYPDSFPDMDKIWITPGPRESIIIKNNSKAVMMHSGKEYGHREKVQLFYNDKIYIVFAKDEDEIELYYKQSKPTSSRVTGSKISVAVS